MQDWPQFPQWELFVSVSTQLPEQVVGAVSGQLHPSVMPENVPLLQVALTVPLHPAEHATELGFPLFAAGKVAFPQEAVGNC